MTFWKKFAINFISIFVLYIIPTSVAHSCAYDPGFQGYAFFDANTINTNSLYAPYFLGFADFYNKKLNPQKDQVDANLNEWRERFCNLVGVEDLRKVIYRSKLPELITLQTSIKSKAIKINAPFRNNSFARHLKQHKCHETIEYLIFAKRCEPYATWVKSWDNKDRNVKGMEQLIKKAKTKFSKSKSHYFKLRYAYQAIRLAHYAGKYQEALDLYDFFIPKKENDESIIDYWILGHKAGALQGLGKNVEAAYLYTQIFMNCPSKRTSAFRSFKIKTDEEWLHCMELCRNDEEKATMYTLRAGSRHSNLTEEMQSIYKIDPANENLEILLVKEIHKLEKDFLGLDFNDRKYENKKRFGIPRKDAGQKLINLNKFVRTVNQEGKIKNPDLWKVTEGYLELLASDFYAAEKTFNKIRKEIKDQRLIDQLKVFDLVLKINMIEDPDEEDEAEIAEIIRRNDEYESHPDFEDFLSDKLSSVYKKDSPGKAFLVQHDMRKLAIHPEMETIDDLLDICTKEEKSDFESLLCSDNGVSITNKLLDLKGTLFLSQGKPEAALAVFKEVPRPAREGQRFNPFREMINDCINCEIKNDTAVYYDKAGVLERMFELEFQGRSDFVNSDLYFYELGIAYYNMSYFGHSWKMMDNFRSGSYAKGVGLENMFKYGQEEMVSGEKATEYFQKVLDLTKDEELKARTLFMLAKIERNNYYISKDYKRPKGRNMIPAAPDKYMTYYKQLKRESMQTEFYKEAVTECKYFRFYTKK